MTTPVVHETVLFDVHDAKISPLLTDASGGTAPTYGAAIDVPGISQVGLDPEFVTAELKGDAKVLARKGKTSGFNLSATYGLLSLDVQKALFGGTVTDDTTLRTSDWELLGANSTPYFMFQFAINDTGGGIAQVQVRLWKSQVTGGSLFDQSTDNFGNRSVQISALPLLSNDKLIRVRLAETITNLGNT